MSEAIAVMDESRSPPPVATTEQARAVGAAIEPSLRRFQPRAAASSSSAAQQQQDDLAQRVGRELNLNEQQLQPQQPPQRAQLQQEHKEDERAICMVCHEVTAPLLPVGCCGQVICRSCPMQMARFSQSLRCPMCRNAPIFQQWFAATFPQQSAAAAANQPVVNAARAFRQEYQQAHLRFLETVGALDTTIAQMRANPFDTATIGRNAVPHTIPLGDRVRREGLLRATTQHNTAVTSVSDAKKAVLVALDRLRDSVKICATRAARKAEYEAVLTDMEQERDALRSEAFNYAMSRRARQSARDAIRFTPY